MVGNLVYFDYAEDPTNICVILSILKKGEYDQDEDLYLVYDFNYRDYYYASIEEVHIIYNQEEL
jgi:hypothetical protein